MESIAEIEFLRQMHHIDQDVTLAINSLNCPFTDQIWMFFSAKTVWFPMYLAVAVFFFVRLGWKKAIPAVLACVLTVVACDQCGNLVKDAVERLRPCWDLNVANRGLHLLEGKGNLYGFYSAHAANAMGFAVCSSICFKQDASRKYNRYTVAITVWAFLVGMSRVFVGKHFFGDVCAGFLAGIVFGALFAVLARRAMSVLERKTSL
ncbi:MAG: phosphatase PAP2 family protein [Bacteroidales bacterium]|nr:phosphatase PAP2 family protein [Bacteroidales bacterium]